MNIMSILDLINTWQNFQNAEEMRSYQKSLDEGREDLSAIEKALFYWVSQIRVSSVTMSQEQELREFWLEFRNLSLDTLKTIIEAPVALFGQQRKIDQLDFIFALYVVKIHYPEYADEAFKKASVFKLGVWAPVLLKDFRNLRFEEPIYMTANAERAHASIQGAHDEKQEQRKRILAILNEYEDGNDFFVHPNIPEKRLKGAVKTTRRPSDEILGVMDATGGGNGKLGVYFLLEEIASKNEWEPVKFINYKELINVAPKKRFDHVKYGSFKAYTNLPGAGCSKDQLIECVNRILGRLPKQASDSD